MRNIFINAFEDYLQSYTLEADPSIVPVSSFQSWKEIHVEKFSVINKIEVDEINSFISLTYKLGSW